MKEGDLKKSQKCDQLQPYAETLSKDLPLILSMSDSTFLPLLKNWLLAIDQLDVTNVCIVALDRETFEYLQTKSIPALYSPTHDSPTKNRNSALQHKTAIVKYFLHQGFDVLFSDADAIWIKDSRKLLSTPPYSDSHLIFSQAFGHPLSIVKLQGFCLCSGFYLIRNSSSSRLFLDEWLTYQELYPDHCDQAALNALTHKIVPKWKIPNRHTFTRPEGTECFYSDEPISGNAELKKAKVSLTILPYKQFRRGNSEPADDPYMVHIGSGGNVEKKIAEIKANKPNLWFMS